MAFERWASWFERSRSFQRFKLHHTEINQLYWSLAPVGSCARYLSRNARDDDRPADVFHATGPHARRLAPSIKEWKSDFKEYENWARLSMLVSALSYFEAYTSTVVTLALRSDPLARFGDSKAIDGVSWLKKEMSDDTSELVIACVKGEWSKRFSGYHRLFTTIPHGLAELEGSLEKMRILRNGSAHSFGRSPSYFEDPLASAGAPERISEELLLEYLGNIEKAAIAIDEHILPAHLGEFDLLMLYHSWQKLPRAEKEPKYLEATAFSRQINRLFGQTPGRAFCKELIAHYAKLR